MIFILGLQLICGQMFKIFNKAYTTAKKKRPNHLGYLVGIWL